GLSAYYHDAAAALVVDGRIVAAAQEERFTRRRHDAGFPAHAARFCLAHAGLRLRDLDAVVFYDKPFLKFERLLETYLASAPHGLRSFVASMPVWLKEKLFLKSELRRRLDELCGPWGTPPPLLFSEHHRSHAASAFYPSPFESAAVLCLDGVGEWATTSAWFGQGTSLQPLWEQHFPHSLGLLYSAFTYYTGFKVNSGEYKMMGLAPYGTPRYAGAIREHLVDVKPDGTFRLDMRYFDYATGLRMTSERFHALFGAPPRDPEQPIVQHTMDVAASIQQVTDEIVLRLAKTLRVETGARSLCLAGGVALNCVTNGRLVRERVFDDVWIQPAAGDAGGALGAALVAWYAKNADAARLPAHPDAMSGALLGPETGDEALEAFLRDQDLPHETLPDDAALGERVAALLADGAVVGWMQGRMEFGPRALGARSILADPRRPDMQRALNLKIKFRESFRPFAPAVLEERAAEVFELDRPSPYMLIVAPLADRPPEGAAASGDGFERLRQVQSALPTITHVDYSARVQTVDAGTNPRFRRLIEAFEQKTGVPVLVNTSFNVRGEPIVCTPADAYRCFMATAMDYLVLGRHVLDRRLQPASHGLTEHAVREFEAD
ncbi:MAG TPA: carbamoyltransferase, partial [Steroidobacteraceae bacterium]|nr:carbamoyltransferase [Steroidobacteraceae bacterium]